MIAMLKRIWIFVVGLVATHADAKRPRLSRKTPDEEFDYYFRDIILDQLDRYFVILKRMRKGDREAYHYFSRLGAHIIPGSGFTRSADALDPWFLKTLPTVGGVCFGIHPVTERLEAKQSVMLPRVVYFRKYDPNKAPPKVQMAAGFPIYVMTAYWDNPSDPNFKHGSPTEFPVAILPDGTVRVLRVRRCESKVIRVKRGRSDLRRGETFAVPTRTWRHDEFFIEWAKEHGEPVEKFLAQIFIRATTGFACASSTMIRVEAIKGKLRATFGVDVTRTPYFFKDRDVTVGDTGARKRIFHVVKPHKRALAGGREIFVKMHFRGERQFHWNGYLISITVPGRDHFHLSELDVALADSAALTKGERLDADLIYSDGVALELRQAMDAGVGGIKPRRAA